MESSPQAAAQEWKKGSFRPAYLFYGEDDAGKLAALEALKSALGLDPLNIGEFAGDDASAGELLDACNTPPMFSARRLAIVRAVKFTAPARRELAAYLKAPLESTTLVFLSEERKLDFKDPLAAAVSALSGAVAFKQLREGEAVSRLREAARAAGLEIAPEAAQRLVEEAGTEWGILRAELEKLRLYVRGRASAQLPDVLACLGYRKEANPYDFPRALESRSLKALSLLRGMLESDSEPFHLLNTVTRTVNGQLKAKRLLKAGLPAAQIGRELRIPDFRVADTLREASKLSETRLLGELRLCLETEVSLKSKSWLDPEIELENLVAKVCA